MSWKKKYRNACEMNLELIDENDFLRDELQRVEEARLNMLKEITVLQARQVFADRNRQWIDDATNWLGNLTARLQSIAMPDTLRADIKRLHDAYHAVGVDYPWQS